MVYGEEMFIEVRLCDLKTYLNPTSYLKKSSQRRTSIKLCFSSLFRLNWPRIWFYNPIYKKWTFFRFQNSHFNIIWHKICMTFYLLRWTYFNDVNVGRNILTNSQLKRILFMSSDKKKWNKTCEWQKKTWEKKITPMKVTSVKMRYQIQTLWSLLNLHQKQTEILPVVWTSHQKSSVTKGVLRNFAKLTGKHFCESFF